VEPDHIKILLAVAIIWGVLIAACIFAARHDKRAPADDIGIMWLIVLALYGTLPPLSWLLQGGEYSVASFQRLVRLQPSSGEVLQLMYVGVAYVSGFALVYFSLRRSVPLPNASSHARIAGPQMLGALMFVLAYLMLTTALRAGGYIRESESYVDSYRAIQELPLGVRQVLKLSSGFAAVAKLVLVVAILQRWPRSKRLFIVYLATVVLSYDPSGSRKAAALSLLAGAVCWHILVRPIATRMWVAAGVSGFLIFTILGILRGLGVWEEDGEGLEAAGEFEGIGLGELDALWANAVHMFQERESRLEIPLTARYGELWAFIPSQFLPFDKLALNDWYMETFFPTYKEMGGGWEFGALTQAVIGGGVWEAVIRGAVVALLAIGLMTWYRSPTATWWRLPLYLYLLTLAFLSIRDTTFRPLVEFAQVGVPALFLVELMAELLGSLSRRAQYSGPNPMLTTKA
jgi:hypothetical protein